MNSQTNSTPRELRAEAAAWVARLHSSARTPALEEGFRRWLEVSPTNARAFEMASEAWDIGGAIPANAFPRIAHRSTSDSRRKRSWTDLFYSAPGLAVSAVLILTIAGIVAYKQREGSIVSTAVGEQRLLTLRDGSHISLNTNTRLYVRYQKTSRIIELASGEALFDVARDPSRPFIVSAGGKRVVALGTAFVVRRDSREVIVTLVQGKVQVSTPRVAEETADSTSKTSQSEILEPGQQVTFMDDKPPKLDRPALDKVTAWRRGEVILDKTRLQEAVEDLNRYSETKLVVLDPATADIRVSGIFRTGDSVRFAQAVAETYHLHLERREDEISLSGFRAP